MSLLPKEELKEIADWFRPDYENGEPVHSIESDFVFMLFDHIAALEQKIKVASELLLASNPEGAYIILTGKGLV